VSDLLLSLLCILAPLVFVRVWSVLRERAHDQRLAEAERELAGIQLSTLTRLPEGYDSAVLLSGSVVVGADYYKRFWAGLKSLIGGQLGVLEPVLLRARREAMIRIQREALAAGCTSVVGVRLETSELTARSNDRVAAIEMLVYGTGVRAPEPE